MAAQFETCRGSVKPSHPRLASNADPSALRPGGPAGPLCRQTAPNLIPPTDRNDDLLRSILDSAVISKEMPRPAGSKEATPHHQAVALQ
eukprot:scaffold261877_cov48-Prasinocladus_malaysianus.AAC.1